MPEEIYKEAAQKVTAWYRSHGRDLPWRRTKDPYAIWISEIMLQQTQVETVKPYYERFIHALPTADDLARADEQQVFKLWEGLGYYRRAAHLKEAAETIVRDYQGRFPDTYDELLKLKGVGMYTASAIASIAFGIPKGVVDGNTLRIVSRLLNREDNIALQKTKNAFGEVMDAMIRYADPSDFNQGMMDLGAMICTPVKPACEACPIASLCQAKACGTEGRLPVNNKKINKSILEYMTVVIRDGDRFFMVPNEKGLLQNLYGFVQYNCDTPSEFERLFYNQYGVRVRLTQYVSDIKHVFTHREWRMHVYGGEAVVSGLAEGRTDFYSLEEIEKLPVSTAHLKVLKSYLKAMN